MRQNQLIINNEQLTIKRTKSRLEGERVTLLQQGSPAPAGINQWNLSANWRTNAPINTNIITNHFM
ncbi:MAG TPA: hypothetical protein VJ455_00625 [Ignavibacteria bacterium]|nr:hypothetical protein [Ignavibacteria bacterium]